MWTMGLGFNSPEYSDVVRVGLEFEKGTIKSRRDGLVQGHGDFLLAAMCQQRPAPIRPEYYS